MKTKGSFTIEASFVVPVVLFVFIVLMNVLFYYHDKNILTAVAHETVCVGCGRTGQGPEELEQYFYSRVNGRLLVFTWVQGDISADETSILLQCRASGKRMTLQVDCTMDKTEPETHIRKLRKIKKMGEKIGELH